MSSKKPELKLECCGGSGHCGKICEGFPCDEVGEDDLCAGCPCGEDCMEEYP